MGVRKLYVTGVETGYCGARAPLIDMVSYQTWTQIAFDVAKEKGMETTQSNVQEGVSAFATIWNQRKEALSAATRSEAEDIAEQEIVVR